MRYVIQTVLLLQACTLVDLDDLEEGTTGSGAASASITATTTAATDAVTVTDATTVGDATAASATSASSGPGASSAYAERIMMDGPAVYFRFDDPEDMDAVRTTPLTDALTARFHAMPSYDRGVNAGALAGDASRAIHFDGASDSYVELAPGLEFADDGAFTIELWFRPGEMTQPQMLFSNDLGDVSMGERNGYSVILIDDRTIAFELFERGKMMPIGVYLSSPPAGPPRFSAGVWYHFVATRQQLVLRAYLDGALGVENTNAGVDLLVDGASARIGGKQDSPLYDFTGDIDELAVYPSALDEDTIHQHFVVGTDSSVR